MLFDLIISNTNVESKGTEVNNVKFADIYIYVYIFIYIYILNVVEIIMNINNLY